MNRQLMYPLMATSIFLSFAQLATAQHFDVFVGRPAAGSQTAYGGIDVNTSAITLSQRIFEAEMGEDPFDGSFTSVEPGFNHPADDGALPAATASLLVGDEVFVQAISLEVGNSSSNLFYWNGMAPVSFVPAVGVNFTMETGNTSGSIGTAGSGGEFDDHPILVLNDNDGVATTRPATGIYLASFETRVADLAPSDPLYLIMGTEGLITAEFLGITPQEFDMLTDEQLDEALEGVIEMADEFVAQNVVPEPMSMTAVGALLIICSVSSRRRSR